MDTKSKVSSESFCLEPNLHVWVYMSGASRAWASLLGLFGWERPRGLIKGFPIRSTSSIVLPQFQRAASARSPRSEAAPEIEAAPKSRQHAFGTGIWPGMFPLKQNSLSSETHLIFTACLLDYRSTSISACCFSEPPPPEAAPKIEAAPKSTRNVYGTP